MKCMLIYACKTLLRIGNLWIPISGRTKLVADLCFPAFRSDSAVGMSHDIHSLYLYRKLHVGCPSASVRRDRWRMVPIRFGSTICAEYNV